MKRLGIGMLMSVLAVLVTVSPASAASSSEGCVVRPAGNIITADMAGKINTLKPLYQQAAAGSAASWLMLVPLHYRETDLNRSNPANGQGIFQLWSYTQSAHQRFAPAASVSDADFVQQAKLALGHLNDKAQLADRDGLRSANLATMAWALFGYNGRAQAYYQQAQQLHEQLKVQFPAAYQYPFEGSPYVYNLFDEAHTGRLRLIQQDGGGLTSAIDDRPGAFTVYYELLRQCDPGALGLAARLTSASTPVTPFAGETVPYLPADDHLPPPLYTIAAIIMCVALVPLFRLTHKHPLWRTAWAMAAVGTPVMVHYDRFALAASPLWRAITLQRSFIYSGLAVVTVLALFGAFKAIEEHEPGTAKRSIVSRAPLWALGWLRLHWRPLRIAGAVAAGMVGVFKFTGRFNPSDPQFTLMAMGLVAAAALTAAALPWGKGQRAVNA